VNDGVRTAMSAGWQESSRAKHSRGTLSSGDDDGMGINNLGTLDYGCDFKLNATSD
jgi:hypothetical protein